MTPDLNPFATVQEAPSTLQEESPGLRVAFWTLGCRLNQYDTEGIKAAMVASYPVEIVGWQDSAHVYVLNSCTVTGKADQECRRLARQAKRRNPDSKVVVVGCYAQTQPESLAKVSEIDAVVGNTAKEDVEAWLPELLEGEAQFVAVEEFAPRPAFDSPLIDDFSGRSRAFVKIQDGCNLRCTYCLIWKARGPGRSRSVQDISTQLQRLVDAGFHETILAGIHLGGYGRDLEPKVLLPDLLEILLERFPTLRLRLSSIHPNEVTPRLLGLFRDNPRLRPHLHISLQSGSDGVLKRMKRPYRGQRAWDAIGNAAQVAPAFGLGADIIVGFPGETTAEFEDTRRMIAELPFSYLHVFRYSQRPGTTAADMGDQVHPETISERSAVLRALAEQKQLEFETGLVGTVREAVVESDTDLPGWRKATTDNYVSILVPDTLETGSLIQARILRHEDGKLFAEVKEALQ